MSKLEQATKGILQGLCLLIVTFAIFGILGMQLQHNEVTFFDSFFTFFTVSFQDPSWVQTMLTASQNSQNPELRLSNTNYLVLFTYTACVFISRYLIGGFIAAKILKEFLKPRLSN